MVEIGTATTNAMLVDEMHNLSLCDFLLQVR